MEGCCDYNFVRKPAGAFPKASNKVTAKVFLRLWIALDSRLISW
jgi:hypothetical protein